MYWRLTVVREATADALRTRRRLGIQERERDRHLLRPIYCSAHPPRIARSNFIPATKQLETHRLASPSIILGRPKGGTATNSAGGRGCRRKSPSQGERSA